MPGHIKSVREGELGWIIFDHPERRSAISASMSSELAEAVGASGQAAAVRGVIMRVPSSWPQEK